jgi:hypothetical protein
MSRLANASAASAICRNLVDGFEDSSVSQCLGSKDLSHEVMDVFCADAELSFSGSTSWN